MRALQFIAIVMLLAAIVAPFLRRRPAGNAPRPSLDELVKDPVCQTYVVRSRAVRGAAAGPPYFCSTECARRWAAEPRG